MKESKKKAQRLRCFEALKERPITTKMLQAKTNIPRENITRHIAELEKRNKVVTVEQKKCQITGHTAKYYSTDKKYFPPERQPELFPKKTKSRAYQI